MSVRIASFLLIALILNSCASSHKSLINATNWPYPMHQFDEQFSFSYADDLLEKTNNKAGARWAKRKNIHVISIRLVNNGNKSIHGSQLVFYNGDEQLELIHNEWLAKKVRQRFSPLMILWLPVFIVEAALWNRADVDHDSDNFDPIISGGIASNVENNRKFANFDLRQELLDFQLGTQVIYPGRTIHGVIGVKSKHKLNELKIDLKGVDFIIR